MHTSYPSQPPCLGIFFCLDFLAGNQTFKCTLWGNPTRNVFGWQRPCYLLVDEGYAPSFRSLMEDTRWERYGTGRNPKCANCMAHCGYESTAVNAAFAHPLGALRASLYGPTTEGPMAPENSLEYASSIPEREVELSVDMLSGKRKIIN